jgi:hypothetical protein
MKTAPNAKRVPMNECLSEIDVGAVVARKKSRGSRPGFA